MAVALAGSLGATLAAGLNRLLSPSSTAGVSLQPWSNQTPTQITPLESSQASITVSGLGKLLSGLSSFSSTLSAYQPPQYNLPTVALSSNPSVATAQASNGASGSYALDVAPIASGQVIRSAAFASADQTVVGSGSLTIQLGTVSKISSSDAATDSTSTSFDPANQLGYPFFSSGGATLSLTNATLNDVANAINNGNTGVTASVVSDSSGYSLQLSANTTGSSSAFSISGDFKALNFDPAKPAANSSSLLQTAQDAAYAVNGAAASSATNRAIPVGTGITADLQGNGSTSIATASDISGLRQVANALVGALNQLVQTSVQVGKGAGDSLSGSVASELPADLVSLANRANNGGNASFAGLASIGITSSNDSSGTPTFNLDSTTLGAAYRNDPYATGSILSQALSDFQQLSKDYSSSLSSASTQIQNAVYQAQSTAFAKAYGSNYQGSSGLLQPVAGLGNGSLPASPLDVVKQYAQVALQNQSDNLAAGVIKSIAKPGKLSLFA